MTFERRSYLLRCTLAAALVCLGLSLYYSSHFFSGVSGRIVRRRDGGGRTTLYLDDGQRVVQERVAMEIARSCVNTYERKPFAFSYACDGRAPTFTSGPIGALLGATLFLALGVYNFVKRRQRWWWRDRGRKFPYDLLSR